MSSCKSQYGDKVKHINKVEAVKHAITHQKRTNVKVEVYKCPKCSMWHIGRHKTTKKERMRLYYNESDKVDERIVVELIQALKLTLPRKYQ